ncbi:MAG TPA: c-type cytochrome [Acidocella sp.]|nr:c-type cytochrome [Acidocella sp.]
MRGWRIAPLLLLAAAAPAGQQIVLHGNGNGALPCAACHGAEGAGKPAIGAPALAGKPAGDIVAALNAMAARQGGTGLMPAIAGALTPQQRQDVASYFSSLPAP